MKTKEEIRCKVCDAICKGNCIIRNYLIEEPVICCEVCFQLWAEQGFDKLEKRLKNERKKIIEIVNLNQGKPNTCRSCYYADNDLGIVALHCTCKEKEAKAKHHDEYGKVRSWETCKHWKKSKEYINCECCDKKIVKYANNKRCSSCAVYIKALIDKLAQYKRNIERYRILLYGQKSGRERLRFKQKIEEK